MADTKPSSRNRGSAASTHIAMPTKSGVPAASEAPKSTKTPSFAQPSGPGHSTRANKTYH